MDAKTMIPKKRFLNIHELSEFLGICVNTIYSWVSQDKIPFVKVGHLLRFDAGKIETWLANRTHEVKETKSLEF